MRLKRGFSLFLACLLCSASAYSAERLSFKDKAPSSDILNAVSVSDNYDDWITSTIDLNNDGLPEKIIKSDRQSCNDKNGCQYIVMAQKGRNWIELGDIKAFNILVSDDRTYGIRDLLVYATPNNDFDFERHAWNPRTYRYEAQ
ncbi:MAG: hypothetical protein AAF569_00290 [Pseudomonadota bacterium]